MFLEIATTMGALFGADLLAKTSASALGVIFGFVLLYSAYQSSRPEPPTRLDLSPDSLATRLRLRGEFPGEQDSQKYVAQRVEAGFALIFGAGTLSGLLGIGSGEGEGDCHGPSDSAAVQSLDSDE